MYVLDSSTFEEIETVILNLTQIQDEIYQLYFEKMIFLENNNLLGSKEFKECLNKLEVLKIKEKRILKNFGDNFGYFDYDLWIDMFVNNVTFDDHEKNLIKQRMEYLFLKEELQDEFYFDDEDYDNFDTEEIENYLKNQKELNIQFICQIANDMNLMPRLVKYKYEHIFKNPSIEDEFLLAGFNPDNMFEISDEDELELTDEDIIDYEYEKAEFTYGYTADLIEKLLQNGKNKNIIRTFHFEDGKCTSISDNRKEQVDNIKNMLDELKFLVTKVETTDLPELKSFYAMAMQDNDFVNVTNKATTVQAINNIINHELSNRDDYNICLDRTYELADDQISEADMENVSPELTDYIFALVKQTSKVCDYSELLSIQEKNGNDITDEISKLKSEIDKETLALNSLTLNVDDKITFKYILDKYIDIILAKERDLSINDLKTDAYFNKNDLIKRRIYNLIPDLEFIDDSIYKSSYVPTLIIQNHMINVLKSYDKYLKEAKDNKNSLIEIKYEEIISDPDLTYDFIESHGDVQMMTSLDNKTTSEILDITLDEYLYDKNKLLYNYAMEVFDNLSYIDVTKLDNKSKAFLDFYAIYLTEAMKDMDKNMIENLEDNYDCSRDDKAPTLNYLKQNHKIKQKKI